MPVLHSQPLGPTYQAPPIPAGHEQPSIPSAEYDILWPSRVGGGFVCRGRSPLSIGEGGLDPPVLDGILLSASLSLAKVEAEDLVGLAVLGGCIWALIILCLGEEAAGFLAPRDIHLSGRYYSNGSHARTVLFLEHRTILPDLLMSLWECGTLEGSLGTGPQLSEGALVWLWRNHFI